MADETLPYSTHGAVIGEATKKSTPDKLLTDILQLQDYIKGDNFHASGVDGHNHDGTDGVEVHQLKSLTDSATDAGSSANSYTFTLDDTIDWRDRNILINGCVAWGGIYSTLAECEKILPIGGTERDQLYYTKSITADDNGAPAFATVGGYLGTEYDIGIGWMYSGAGSATAGSPAVPAVPYIFFPGSSANVYALSAYIWVDSATGYLKLTCTYSATGSGRHAAWVLQIQHSNDLGGV